MDSEQKESMRFIMKRMADTAVLYSLNLYWYNYVSSYYGYRINPVTGAEQLHQGR